MKAILLKEHGTADQLYVGDFPTPEAQPHEVTVRVHATALNRADILQREGHYPPPLGASPILGLEIAGEVVAVGRKVTRWRKGDKVFGLVPGGGYAEFAVIHEDMALPIPRGWDFTKAAAIPEVFLTAFQALRWVGKLAKGEKVLLHAGASGVGTAAIQLARLMGAEVVVTASSGKHQLCLDLGANHAIDYKKGPFLDELKELTNGEGVNVVVDPVGGDYFNQNIQALQPDGRLVMLAIMGGGQVATNIGPIIFKRLQVLGTTLRARSRDYQIKLTQEFSAYAYEYLLTNALHPVIDEVFAWEDVAKAHRYMEANLSAGKVVLRIRD